MTVDSTADYYYLFTELPPSAAVVPWPANAVFHRAHNTRTRASRHLAVAIAHFDKSNAKTPCEFATLFDTADTTTQLSVDERHKKTMNVEYFSNTAKSVCHPHGQILFEHFDVLRRLCLEPDSAIDTARLYRLAISCSTHSSSFTAHSF